MNKTLEIKALIPLIEQWADDKGIADKFAQFTKVSEEIGELASGLARDDHNEIKDAFGDVLVTLIVLAHITGYDLEECLNIAYQEIKGRKGTLVDGVFVKDE